VTSTDDPLERPTVVVFRDSIVRILSTTTYSLQCVARTTKRARRKNFVEGGQQGRWDERHSLRGQVDIYDVSHLSPETTQRWLEQHCEQHESPETVDAVAVDWQIPDFEIAHAHLVEPLPVDWEW
jgi:hypothetical protein